MTFSLTVGYFTLSLETLQTLQTLSILGKDHNIMEVCKK